MKKRIVMILMTMILSLSISGVVSANDSSMAPEVGESFGYIPDYVDNFWFDYNYHPWWSDCGYEDGNCLYGYGYYNAIVDEDGNLIFYYPYFPFEIGRPPVFSRDYDDYDYDDDDYDYDDDYHPASGSFGKWNKDFKPEASIIPVPSKDYSAGGSSLPNIATIQ